MVEVEQRPLRALEEHPLTFLERLVDDQRGVLDEGAQALRVLLVALGYVLQIEDRRFVDALEPAVLLGQCDLDLLAQDLGVEHVLNPDADPQGFVGVGRPDATLGRADLELAQPPLRGLIDRHVPGHDQVRVPRQAERLGRVAPVLDLVDLPDQDFGIDDAAVPDHGDLAGDDSGRDLANLEGLFGDLDRVTRVRATLIAANQI